MSSTTTIEVSVDTWQRLNSQKRPGETFDDVIQELVEAGERGERQDV